MVEKKRRAQGEGGLYQRADGRWEATLHLGWGPDGKRLRRKVVAKTKAEAASRIAQVRREVDAGLNPQAGKLTVGAWLDTWLRDEAAPTVRPRTLVQYQTIVRLHLRPALGHIKLRALTPSQIRKYEADKVAGGLSPRSVQNHHIVLRRALEVATRYQYVDRNVARLVSAPRAERHESRPLTRDEATRLLTAAAGHPLEALFVLAASTGMRRAEVLGLTWQHVDLDAGTVRVEKTLVRYDGAYHLDPPKTAQSRRTVVIPGGVVDALRAHRQRQTDAAVAAEVWGNAWGLVFTDAIGRPVSERRVHSEFWALLDRAQVRRVRFHDLRHGAATFLLAQGVPMKVVQSILGHAQIAITADLYSHVAPELHRDAADRIGALLFGGAGEDGQKVGSR
ncbi:MAG: tyrosine-type recombinase/integrase [Dehalococcoidia bacterium]|nr:tyrosine-type recombinase/integrase [Dehalococcoidia bacterium]